MYVTIQIKEEFAMQTPTKQNKFSKKDIFIFILMISTAVLISAAGIINKQKFPLIMPLYVSLIIGMLQSRVNRFASLMGSINSLVYAAVYAYYHLYASAFSALLFSCPIQLLTFIRWNKNKWEHSTKLRKLSNKQRILIAVGYVAALIILWVVLPLIGSEYVFLDSITNVLGILIYFLTMFAYVEYTFLMIINGIIGIVLYVTMLEANPETVTYLIFSVYSFICVTFAFFEARKLHANQQKENNSAENKKD